ncbi:putative phosphatase regulatory subunit-domain-containing protein [Russula earlei]|uniref:Phosphatase regulatory subunit-domain-containing protein n=1 Tax=Russula earlei TaxID=71964 RepID=A0ACC0UAJ5_9AGAM|nr:putative phosphatase regulatory subunit-domain-containing protein [Russula earlei]
MPYVPSRSPITFSNEPGPGAFAPLSSLPKRSKVKKSLFHIPTDDDEQQDDPSPPRSPPQSLSNPLPSDRSVDPPSVPFPTVSPESPTFSTLPKPPIPPIKRTPSSTSVILPNGRPLKPSLKSASSSSITDDMAASASRHARAQSMPATPAFGPKNVHFKEKDDGLETVRLFRRTGKPVSVSKPTSDTETETEPEPSAFPFPRISTNNFGSSASSLSEIANSSPIPASNPSPYANIHIESIALPPARPPVLRGTVLVRNIVFEKHVSVRFTLDDWTTVSEVFATYTGPVAALETLAGANQGKTVGDLIGSSGGASQWDRFSFAIKLEDYEAFLWQRTLFLVIRYSAPGLGEFWDNNSGDNYRITFRPYSGLAQPERKRGSSAPSMAPFLLGSTSPPSPLASRIASHDEPRPTFSPPPRPLAIPRSASVPVPSAVGHRLNLRHYAAPTPPPPRSMPPVNLPPPLPPSGLSRVDPGIQSTSSTPPEKPTPGKVPTRDKDEVDEGFATGSEDSDVTDTRSTSRPRLSLNISPPSPVTVRQVSPVSPTPSPPPRQQVPFSPAREPFSPRSGGGSDDSTFAILVREWCFTQGSDTFGAGATMGVQSAAPWVGGLF